MYTIIMWFLIKRSVEKMEILFRCFNAHFFVYRANEPSLLINLKKYYYIFQLQLAYSFSCYVTDVTFLQTNNLLAIYIFKQYWIQLFISNFYGIQPTYIDEIKVLSLFGIFPASILWRNPCRPFCKISQPRCSLGLCKVVSYIFLSFDCLIYLWHPRILNSIHFLPSYQWTERWHTYIHSIVLSSQLSEILTVVTVSEAFGSNLSCHHASSTIFRPSQLSK